MEDGSKQGGASEDMAASGWLLLALSLLLLLLALLLRLVDRWLLLTQGACDKLHNTYLGNGSGILFREYCFGEENSLSLTDFYGRLGEFCEHFGKFALAH